MDSKISNTNVSFGILKNSSAFLNLILDNITSCVLLLNKDCELIAFNNALKTIFSNKSNEDLLYKKCGEAIGCAYQLEEDKDCGSTNHCAECELRNAILHSYIKNQPVFKEHIVKPFYMNNGEKVDKHLQFSTRLFEYEKDKYIIMIIEDISKFFNS